MQKSMLTVTGLFVAVVVGGAAYLLAAPEPDPAAQSHSLARLDIGDATFGAPFTLTDQTGARVTEADVIDGPTLIYFGYTFCPDVCPVDTTVMADAATLLEEAGHDVTPVFVSIDPARDTPEVLADFAAYVSEKTVALTGTEEEIRSMADAYRVFYDRVDVEESAAEYLMNHSTFMYFMMPDGVAAVFRRGFPAEEIADEVARILEARA